MIKKIIRPLGSAVFKKIKWGLNTVKTWIKERGRRIMGTMKGLSKRYRNAIILIGIGLIVWLLIGWWVVSAGKGWWIVPVGTVPVGIGFFLLTYFVLAPLKIDFTFVDESSGQAVVRGGQLVKFLITWADHTFRKTAEGKQSTEAANWEVVKGKEPFHLFGGLRMYSWKWPLDRILEYHQEWTHLHEDGKAKSHKEDMFHILLSLDLYVIEYPLTSKEAAEDIDGVPIGLQVILPMQTVNPYVALFVVRRWLAIITGVVKATLRPFFAHYRYREDLLGLRAGKGIEQKQEEAGVPLEKRAKAGDDLRQKMFEEIGAALARRAKEEGANIEERQEGLYMFGVLIKKEGMDLLNIEPDPSYREATTLKYRAERDKEKKIVDAEGEEARIEKVFSRIAKFGEVGKLVRVLEAVEKSPLAASLTVQAVPGLQEALRGVFGRPPGEITSGEFRKLRETVEKMARQMEELRKK